MSGRARTHGGLRSIGFGIALISACTHVETREDVVRSLAADVAASDVLTVSRAASALHDVLKGAADADVPLARAHAAHTALMIAVERAYALHRGPLVDANTLFRAAFFPIREAELAARIAAEPAPNTAVIDGLGVDLKGVYALEALLYAPPGSPLSPERAGSETHRRWLSVLSADILNQVDKAHGTLRSTGRLADTWGKDADGVLNGVVNDLVAQVETLAAERIKAPHDRYLGPQHSTGDIRGGKSHLSARIVRESAEALRRVYGAAPTGIAGLVQRAAPEVQVRIDAAFADVTTHLKSFDAGLEQLLEAGRERELAEATTSLRGLEQRLKVDLVAALGLTLTFSSSDGD